jgi:hypothetical protein
LLVPPDVLDLTETTAFQNSIRWKVAAVESMKRPQFALFGMPKVIDPMDFSR